MPRPSSLTTHGFSQATLLKVLLKLLLKVLLKLLLKVRLKLRVLQRKVLRGVLKVLPRFLGLLVESPQSATLLRRCPH
jgi:hypothetical protein